MWWTIVIIVIATIEVIEEERRLKEIKALRRELRNDQAKSQTSAKKNQETRKRRSFSGLISNLQGYFDANRKKDDIKVLLAVVCEQYLRGAEAKESSPSDSDLKVVQEFAKSPATADSQLVGKVLEVVKPSLNKWLAEAYKKKFEHLKELENKQKEVSDKHFEKDLKKEDLLAKQDVKGLTDQERNELERLEKEVSNLEKEKLDLRDQLVFTKTFLTVIKALQGVDWSAEQSIDENSEHGRAMSLLAKELDGEQLEEEEKDFLTNYSLIYEDQKDKDDQLKT